MSGDGFDDIIIRTYFTDPQCESHVLFDGSNVGNSGMIELFASDGTNGFVIIGIDAGDGSGYSVRTAGDVDGWFR
jgi:hypothetical protein